MATKKTREEARLSLGQFWLGELDSAAKSFDRWEERAIKVVRRYRDERDVVEGRQRKFNILWSNVQVLKPALYGRPAKPEVTRRFKDQDPVGRTAALMLERCLEFEVEQYPDWHAAMNGAVEDRLLPGRGIAWVRFEPNTGAEAQVSEDVDATVARTTYECAPTDYVYWRDFTHSPARTWEEVWWVARRVYMTREELSTRFGEIGVLVPLQYEDRSAIEKEIPKEALKRKAQVWEVWDKSEKQTVWVAKGFDRELDKRTDPLQLEGFFPCPRPLYATITTGSLVPVPDYAQYQDQAQELDAITQRIGKLTQALKVVGVYNAEYPAVKRMLAEGVDNDLVPVDTWASFAEKNGLTGAIQFMELRHVVEALVQLYEAREQVKQIIYEITGLSDILRGATKAQETLGAQHLKASFGSMRLSTPQEDVARFASDLLQMKAQIICRFFSDKTILGMSGVMTTLDGQYAQPALKLLRQGPLKDFRIQVEADSLARIDEQQEKTDRVEFLTAAGGFLEKALPVIQQVPAAGQLLGEMLLFGVRGFRVGKSIEAAFERAMSQLGATQQQGMPAEVQTEIQQGREQLMKDGVKLHEERVSLNAEKQVYEVIKRADAQVAAAQSEALKKEVDATLTRFDATKHAREMEVGELDRQADEATNRASEATVKADNRVEQASELAQMLAQLLKVMSAPRRVVRDQNGRAVGVEPVVS